MDQSSSRTFPRRPESVRAARTFVSDAIGPISDRDVVQLLTAELVTNAVLHSAGSQFTVRASARDSCVLVEVIDVDPAHPVQRSPQVHDTGGRGLLIVNGLAKSWGVDDLGVGKSVWFTVERSGAG